MRHGVIVARRHRRVDVNGDVDGEQAESTQASYDSRNEKVIGGQVETDSEERNSTSNFEGT